MSLAKQLLKIWCCGYSGCRSHLPRQEHSSCISTVSQLPSQKQTDLFSLLCAVLFHAPNSCRVPFQGPSVPCPSLPCVTLVFPCKHSTAQGFQFTFSLVEALQLSLLSSMFDRLKRLSSSAVNLQQSSKRYLLRLEQAVQLCQTLDLLLVFIIFLKRT